jgi:hypothetical protein
MPDDERMSIDERRKYLRLVAPRYAKAGRVERSGLLTEIVAVTGLHRKSVLRLLQGVTLDRVPRRPRSRRSRYGSAVQDVVRVVWETCDYACAERLTPELLRLARHLAGFGEVALSPEVEEALGSISRATVQRLLRRFRRDSPRLPRRRPQPANVLLREVPMERLSWTIDCPGTFETDLVHHSGPVTEGEYLHTLQMIDIATGWSERVAILGRSQTAMVEGFERVRRRLPFPIRHLHPDNGSEFFNNHLIRYFGREVTGLTLSRSRPFHKNDNRFVEQKNNTLVRAYLGYDRLDTPQQWVAVNALYDQLWVYYNLFQPVLHLIGKDIVAGKMKRRWDRARTPYQRLLESGALSQEQRIRLEGLYERTNPRQLRRDIYRALGKLADQPRTSIGSNTKEAALPR